MNILERIMNFESIEGNKERVCEALCKDIQDCNNPSYVMEFIEKNRDTLNEYFLEYYDSLKEYGLLKDAIVIDKESKEILKTIQQQKLMTESNRENKYFFISTKNMNKKTLTPRIPSTFVTEAAYEDGSNKRISLHESIEGALMKMRGISKGTVLYVHCPAHDIRVMNPSIKQIPYAKLCQEVWCQKPVTLKCIGKIILEDSKSDKYFSYGEIGNMHKVYCADWEYNWVDKFDEVVHNSFKPATLTNESYLLNDSYFQTKDSVIFFKEASDNDARLKRILYNDRIRNDKELFSIYENIRQNNPWIRYAYIRPERYNERNVFIDMRYYNDAFLRNNLYRNTKGAEIYFDLLLKLLNTKGFESYERRTIFIDVDEYNPKDDTSIYDYKKTINPISMIIYLMTYNPSKLRSGLNKYTIVFFGKTGYFKMTIDDKTEFSRSRFKILVDKLINKEIIQDDNLAKDSPKAIKTDILDRMETSSGIKIHNFTGGEETISKEDLQKKLDNNATKKKEVTDMIDKAAETSNSTDEALDKLNTNEFKKLLLDLAEEEEQKSQVSATRAARMTKLNQEFSKKKIDGVSVKELLDRSKEDRELPESSIPVDSINDEWEHLQFTNFNEIYDNDEDIIAILDFFSTRTNPIAVRNVDKQDTSTTEDSIYTYIVDCEDINGKRFKLTFDVPKFRNGRFMRLRGNEKTISAQLPLLPIIKTDEDTVQIVSNYNKIFIRRFGTSDGKSYSSAGRILKALEKYEGNNIKTKAGDNRKICRKYDLPIDYIDISGTYSTIMIPNQKITIYFNQDEIREKYNVDDSKGLPCAIRGNDILYWNGNTTFSVWLTDLLRENSDSKFMEIYDSIKPAKRYTYSKASILNTEIPVIVIMAYSEGLFTALKKNNINYELLEARPHINLDTHDVIKFNDGYLVYELNYASSLLMNGLKECGTEAYSIKEVNSKLMWLDFLDQFGGRIKADGLDNFYDLMMDPITIEVCKDFDLPYDYIEVLAYANMLLVDNKYNKHTDLSGNRYRTKEIISGYVYKSLATSYGQYSNMLKRSKKDATMSIKRSQVIDNIMMDPTAGDLSVFTPLLEVEAANAVSFKGLAGMNSDRSYGLDKRTFDRTMLNKLAMSTGFAGNVAITRQATINAGIEGKRGYVKAEDGEMNDVNTLCFTEALTPMCTTRDDPFRTAMTFIQTNKHSMRTKVSTPLLVTNGSDEALGYMCSNMFAFKAKDKGTITDLTEDYMIITYNDKTTEFVDLRENIKKNSDGGFFGVLKLDTDLKVGDKVKPGQIVAYDKFSFSKSVGKKANPQYNIGLLAKIAVMTTDEGYEDSAIISPWLSKAMASEVVVKKEITLPKNTNILSMVKKGQEIQEGDPLMIFQNAFDEDDLNTLMKNLADEGDDISDLGRVKVKSKVTGVVQDIVIYRTVETDELSDSLKKVVKDYESSVSKVKRIADKCNNDTEDIFTPNYKLDPVGKLKHAKDSVLIEFYLKYEDEMGIGDKLVYDRALKGVTKDIFPEGKEPTSEFRPDERIEAFLSVASINGRMVGSVLNIWSLNKIMIELGRSVKDIMGLPYDFEINDQP